MDKARLRRQILLLLCLLWVASTRLALCIHVERVVVPPNVIAGNRVELQCLYKEEGDELYSLKWWKGDQQFYQYIPPNRSFYSISGVRVNMSATKSVNEVTPSGLERVILENVQLDTAGVFKCEVMADKIFQTVYKEANMTVIVPPAAAPTITGFDRSQPTVSLGQRFSLDCSIPVASPLPKLIWKVNNRHVGNIADVDWFTYKPVRFTGSAVPVVSNLEFILTQEMIDASTNQLVIRCIGSQPESSYLKEDIIYLQPERTSLFWFLSHGCLGCRPNFFTIVSPCFLYAVITWSHF